MAGGTYDDSKMIAGAAYTAFACLGLESTAESMATGVALEN